MQVDCYSQTGGHQSTAWHKHLQWLQGCGLGGILVMAADNQGCSFENRTMSQTMRWESGSEKQAIRTLTENDNGREVVLGQGEEFVIKLGAILGTGYSWHASRVDTEFLELRGESVLHEHGDLLLGRPEYKIFRFVGKKRGSAVIELKYSRVWEKERLSARTFRIAVHIQS